MVAWTEPEKTVLPWALIFIVIVSIVVCVLTAKKDNKIKRIPLMIISVIILGLEITKQIINIINGYSLWSIPLHFCSLFLYLFPLASFFSDKLGNFGKTMSFVCGTLFLVLFYFNPSSIIGNSCANVFASFSSFHTFIYHHFIILFLLILLGSKLYLPSKYDFLHVFIGITLYALIAVPLAHILNVNFCSLLTNVIPFMEELRLATGQVVYTTVMYLVGVGGGFVAVGIANLIKLLVIKGKQKDNFKIIMKILKSRG